MRTEKDFIGSKKIPKNALYGIQSLRAKENFPDDTRFDKNWYQAVGEVKQACFITYKSFSQALLSKYKTEKIPFPLIPDKILDVLIDAATEISKGKYFEDFIVPAIQGGAGTSINMNINEIIANVALQKLGQTIANYKLIDPIEHANIYQSTNDVIPTSLKIAIMHLLTDLEKSINHLRSKVEETEATTRNDLRIAYTQMQEAVPSSYSKLFSTYCEALSRDWWRVSKCFERIKVVNLGGSAVGTGIGVPRFFIMEVVGQLQKITNLPISRSENLPDATSNLDSFVEVHAILKAHAVNLEKICADIRLLASDISINKEFSIPQKQMGSTIMPGKVNPVIIEFVISVAQKIYANDLLITSLSARGCLDLNAYLPVIGHAMLESIRLLIAADQTICDNIFDGFKIHKEIAQQRLFKSPAITTALSIYIGYHKASEIAKLMKSAGIDIFEANEQLAFIDNEKLKQILKPENLLKTGFSINDLMK
ncbi:MAG: aspartate ammonia-lyase [Bacteroidetes bacterium]|nr:aspartate ammonia-lyase [Bacteroidota bacterium]